VAISELLVSVNNWLVGRRQGKLQPRELLVLLPSCLQWSGCKQNVRTDVANCQRCGRCQVGEVLKEADAFGVEVAMATGGELALQRARAEHVRAIVAVACAKELRAGLLGVWPKAVLAIENQRPNGPCTDTRVQVAEVVSALEFFLGEDARRSEQTTSAEAATERQP